MGLKNVIVRSASTALLKTKEHSPEILVVMGAASMIGSIFTACKATLKFQEDIAKHNERLDKLKVIEQQQQEGTASEEVADIDIKKYRMSVYLDTAKKAVIKYWPSVLLGITSIGCFLGANGILKKRFISMAAAYTAVLKDRNHLEKRIAEEFGEEKLRELKTTDSKQEDVIELDKNGKVKDISKEQKDYSAYSKFFDESNPNWEKNPESNRIFLQLKQNYANHLLQTRGYLFLNDVYEMLEMEKTQAGQIMGWKYYRDTEQAKANGSSNFVDFGIFNANSEAARNFVNGFERSILLDFNVDQNPILGRIGLASA